MATIVIEKETRNKLREVGRKEQTYDDIIMELLEKSKKSSIDSAKSAEQMELY
jgi:predicted CopG family antitoxin